MISMLKINGYKTEFLCWNSFSVLPHHFRTILAWKCIKRHETLFIFKSPKPFKALGFMGIYENPCRYENRLAYYDSEFHFILISFGFSEIKPYNQDSISYQGSKVNSRQLSGFFVIIKRTKNMLS